MESDFNNIEKERFVNYTLEEEASKFETISIKLNKEERIRLNEVKKLLQQPKDSTALKQVFLLGYAFVIQDQKNKLLIETFLGNKRRNERIGIMEVE